MVVSTGLGLLVACPLVGRLMGNTAKGALVFLPLWLVGAVINMWVG